MNDLEELKLKYCNKYSDLKYLEAVDLLNLLTDLEYELICNNNSELMDPISSSEGNSYLKDLNILNKIIDLFTKTIEDRKKNVEEMNSDELKEYIEDVISDLDQEQLCGIAKVINNMLGL